MSGPLACNAVAGAAAHSTAATPIALVTSQSCRPAPTLFILWSLGNITRIAPDAAPPDDHIREKLTASDYRATDASGRTIVEILGNQAGALTGEDFAYMRKVVGFVRRHRAREPHDIATSRRRFSLMNWARDPLKSLNGSARTIAGVEQKRVACFNAARGRAGGCRRRELGQIGEFNMKIISTVAMSFALCALAACNDSPQEEAADNIEANAEMVADNLEETADNATTEAGEDALENQADATRAAGENAADNLEEADTNAANGM